MPRTITLLLLMLASAALWAQPGKPATNTVTINKVASVGSLGEASFSLPPDSSLRIHDRLPALTGSTLQNAACRDGKEDWMEYGKATLLGDTLLVVLFRVTAERIYSLEIKVFGNKFTTKYFLQSHSGGKVIEVVATDQVLTLEHLKFRKGDTISGFVNFRGLNWEAKTPDRPWESRMDWVESTYVVRGPFKIQID